MGGFSPIKLSGAMSAPATLTGLSRDVNRRHFRRPATSIQTNLLEKRGEAGGKEMTGNTTRAAGLPRGSFPDHSPVA